MNDNLEFEAARAQLDRDGIEIRWRAVAWRLAVFACAAIFVALIWIGVVTVYGWIAR